MCTDAELGGFSEVVGEYPGRPSGLSPLSVAMDSSTLRRRRESTASAAQRGPGGGRATLGGPWDVMRVDTESASSRNQPRARLLRDAAAVTRFH